jgi:hypothetical protein
MPWGRLDDGLYDHPKVEQLPRKVRNASVGLWARAISWSNRYLTDGRVSSERLAKLDGTAAEVDALVSVGLFERDDDGIVIHDFCEYNDTAEAVRSKRAAMRELGKRGGLASGEARRSSDTVNRDAQPWRSSAAVEANAKRGAKRNGLNSRPVPLNEERVNEADSSSPGARAPDGPVDPVEESTADLVGTTPWL